MVIADKEAEARKLAQAHYRIEPGITRIFLLTGEADSEVKPNEPIKLLEVNENTIPSGVQPLHFSASPATGYYFDTVIVEVTPGEFDAILSNPASLPHGWQIGKEIERPE